MPYIVMEKIAWKVKSVENMERCFTRLALTLVAVVAKVMPEGSEFW